MDTKGQYFSGDEAWSPKELSANVITEEVPYGEEPSGFTDLSEDVEDEDE